MDFSSSALDVHWRSKHSLKCRASPDVSVNSSDTVLPIPVFLFPTPVKTENWILWQLMTSIVLWRRIDLAVNECCNPAVPLKRNDSQTVDIAGQGPDFCALASMISRRKEVVKRGPN